MILSKLNRSLDRTVSPDDHILDVVSRRLSGIAIERLGRTGNCNIVFV